MVFDYFDGSAGNGFGEKRNRDLMRNIELSPRALNNVEHRDLTVSLFGRTVGLPFGVSPMGMCNLSLPGADLMLAKLAAKNKIPVGVSTAASTSLEKMIEIAEGNAWFQLYFSGN
jgi:(S)-mandelate dehydrogenase